MTTNTRFSGPGGLRILAPLALLVAMSAPGLGQDRPKNDEFNKFEQYRNGSVAIDAGAKDILEKVAKYYALKLTDSGLQKDGMSQHILEFGNRRLPLPPQQPYHKQNPNQRKFVDEFGKIMIVELEPLALTESKFIVRLNATRMASEVARAGYEGAAELFIKILEKPNESDAIKNHALKGLENLFAIEPDKQIPAKTVFQKKDDGQLTPLERKSIQALISFVMRKTEVAENAPEDERNAVRYVRRAAIRALAKVRVQTVKNLGQIEGRPALVLLKAARGDGLTPTVGLGERLEAIVGFGQLMPDKREFDLQVDYGVYHLGMALCELADAKNANLNDLTIPWKVSAARIQESIDKLRATTADMKLPNANLVKEFLEVANTHVLEPLLQAKDGSPPDVNRLRTWLGDRIKLETNASLFKSDPTTVLQVK